MLTQLSKRVIPKTRGQLWHSISHSSSSPSSKSLSNCAASYCTSLFQILITDYCLLIAVIAVSHFISSNFLRMPLTHFPLHLSCTFQMHVWFQVLLNMSPVPLQFPTECFQCFLIWTTLLTFSCIILSSSAFKPLLMQSSLSRTPSSFLKSTSPGLCNSPKSSLILNSTVLTTCMAYSGPCSFSVLWCSLVSTINLIWLKHERWALIT